jgi:hypothetical protein
MQRHILYANAEKSDMSRRPRTFCPFLVTRTAALVAIVAACQQRDYTTSAPPVPTAISVLSGNGQKGVVDQQLARMIVVTVTDQTGSPLPEAIVTWTVGTMGGTVDSLVTHTNVAGAANVQWTLGTFAKVDSLTASILVGGVSTVITATAGAGPFTALTQVSGDSQRVASGGSTSLPLVVQATDQYGNPVAGVMVTWSSNAGMLSAQSTTTGVNGQASVTLATSAQPMQYTITATAGAVAVVNFTLTGT